VRHCKNLRISLSSSNTAIVKGDPVALPSFIKKPLKPIFLKAIQISAALNGEKYRYVFVLSHMRSGSTLLSHILGSHPKFVSAGESHFIHSAPADLQKLVVETCRRLHRVYLRPIYVVDQINWPNVTEETLRSPLIYKCIILIRKPDGALKSMINSIGMTEKGAFDYYIERLKALVEYGQILKERALLVVYDDLVDQTDGTLTALTDFFEVSPPFDPNYKTLRITGKGWGDVSNNILAGRVIRTQFHNVDIDAEALTLASAAFRNCRQQLLYAGVREAN
jgi:hypothetical protein